MAVAFSTWLAHLIAVGPGLQPAMSGGIIRIYPGARPSSPDAAAPTAVAQITTDGLDWSPAPDNSGSGLLLDEVFPGVLEMRDAWVVTGVGAGTGTWWRWYGPDPDGGQQAADRPRIDGDCGTDLVLPSYAFTPEYEHALERFVFGFPPFVS